MRRTLLAGLAASGVLAAGCEPGTPEAAQPTPTQYCTTSTHGDLTETYCTGEPLPAPSTPEPGAAVAPDPDLGIYDLRIGQGAWFDRWILSGALAPNGATGCRLNPTTDAISVGHKDPGLQGPAGVPPVRIQRRNNDPRGNLVFVVTGSHLPTPGIQFVSPNAALEPYNANECPY